MEGIVIAEEKRSVGAHVIVKVKRLREDAQMPKRMTAGAAGADLTCVEATPVGLDVVRYDTGLALEIPPGYVGLLFPRSSVYKTGMDLTNCVGIIDADYRGPVCAFFRRVGPGDHYQPGERCCQLIVKKLDPVEFVEAEELSETVRGVNGYGSTGR